MPINVAVIEDEKEIREMLIVILNGSDGYSCVKVFGNAESAIEQLPSLKVDVVLVDIHLPNKSGIEIIQDLKSKCRGVQFLIYSSLEDNENIFNALKAGANGYITKSTAPAKLLEAISEVHNGGSPMNSHIARRVVTAFHEMNKPADNIALLTSREKEILDHISKGFRYKEIAAKLSISVETVRTHIRNIYEKLQVNSSIEALNKVYNK